MNGTGGDRRGNDRDAHRGGNDRGANDRGGHDRRGHDRRGHDRAGNDRGGKQVRKSRGKSQTPESARTSGDFWGDPARLPPVSEVTASADGSAVIRSLGRPPVTGHEAASEYYFRIACDRAVNLASVLATAGDLLDDEDPD